MRKALRVTTPRTVRQSATQLDADKVVSDWLAIHDPLNDRDYLCTNTTDPAFDFDEFKDIDNEYEGLSVVSMGKDTRRWLKGYNIL
jgi:hypothetical protein